MDTFNNRKFERLTLLCMVAATLWAFSLSAHARKPAVHSVSSRPKPGAVVEPPASAESVTADDASAAPGESGTTAPSTTEHRVQPGEYLGAIAIQYGTTVAELIRMNRIETPDRIKDGTLLIVPANKASAREARPRARRSSGVTITIPRGVTLSHIARAYGVSVRAIVNANPSLSQPDQIRSGGKIRIPGVDTVIELLPPPPCYKTPVEFYRVRTDETQSISLQFCDGRVNLQGVEALSGFASPVGMEMPFPLHTKLVDMMQEVSDAFPGRRIEIISGQRTAKSKGNESYHNKGQALDFRVAGVSAKNLVNVLRKFKNAGVGYYPNSVFVHLDTRDRSAYWIDYSAPGEKAIYGRSDMTVAEIEAIRLARRAEAEQGERENQERFSQNMKAEVEMALREETGEPPPRRLKNDARNAAPEPEAAIAPEPSPQPISSSEV